MRWDERRLHSYIEYANAVIDAGRQWHQVAWRLAKYAQQERVDNDDVAAAYVAYNDARAAFYGCARGDLGLKEPEISFPLAVA